MKMFCFLNNSLLAYICAILITVSSCKESVKPENEPYPNLVGVNDILSFNIDLKQYPAYVEGDIIETIIMSEKDSIYVLVPWYVSQWISPEIEVSPNAVIVPVSGSLLDFSKGTVKYSVQSKDGKKKEWKVFVEWTEKPIFPPDPNNNLLRRPLEDNNPDYPLIKFYTWGNAYATGSDVSRNPTWDNSDLANSYITNTGNPTTDASLHTIYFIVHNAGELQMALRGSSGSNDANTINIRAFINGAPAKNSDGTNYNHSYPYRKTSVTDTLTLHSFILPEIPEGHIGHQIKLEIRGKGARQGDFYYRFYELWLSGWATQGSTGATYNGKPTGVSFSYSVPRDGLAAPSIHMNMTPPAGNMEYFYTEITVPVGYDPLYCYYMTSGNSIGYAGIQTNSPTDRRFLFSIWSPISESDPATLKEKYNPKLVRVCNQPEYRKDITFQVFGGEGTGGQSRINVKWVTGNTYKVLLRIRPHPDQIRFPNSTLIKAWFHNGIEWMFICEWRRQEIQPGDKGVTESTVQGPYWYRSASHFIEDFNGLMGYAPHMAYYSNHWFINDKGEYVEPTGYNFTGNQAYGRADVAGGVVNSGDFYNSIFLKSGGYFTEKNDFPNPIKKPATADKPTLDLEALNAMGTDNPANDSAITPGEQYSE